MADLYGNIPISSGIKKAPEKQQVPDVPQRQPPSRQRTSGKRWLFITPLAVLLLFGGYYVISSALIPFLIKEKFPAVFQTNTGLSLNVDSAQFNPLDCSLIIDGISIDSVEEDGKREDFLTIKDLYADLDLISLLRNGIVSNSLIIKGATFSVFRYPDKSYNISQFFSKSSETAPELMNFAELPFLYSLNNISIRDSSIVFNDIGNGKVHHIEDMNINLPTLSNFSIDVGNYIQPQFSAVVNGSTVELVSETAKAFPDGSEDKVTRLSLTLQSIALPLYADYLPVPLPVTIEKGNADGKIQLSFLNRREKGRQLTLGYQLQIRDAHFQSHDKALSLKAPALNLQGSLDPLKSEVAVTHLLLNDPSLTIGKSFSAATVDSLFLKDYDKKTNGTIPFELPSLTVALLIADNGRILFETEGKDRAFSPVQLSVRNYANPIALRLNPTQVESSFRLSAESENDFSAFSWQGKFHAGTPVGDLEINNLPFAETLRILAPGTATTALGSSDIRGRLSVRRSESAPVSFEYDQGTLRFTSLILNENGKDWLKGATGRAEPVTLKDGKVELGNIFLDNSEVTLSRQKTPSLLQNFGEKKNISMQGIDLKGAITLLPDKEAAKALHLKDVHLQLADLAAPQKKADNFAFTGSAAKSGVIKAKGKISSATASTPLSGIVEVAFTDLPAAALLSDTDSSSISVDAQTTMSGAGKIDLRTHTFEGAVEVDNGLFTDIENNRKYSFEKAAFGKIATDGTIKNFQGDKLFFKNLTIKDDTIEVFSAGTSITAISIQGDAFRIEGLTMAPADISVTPDLSALFTSYLQKKTGSFAVSKAHLSGSIDIFTADRKKTAFIREFECDISSLSNDEAKQENLSFTAYFHDRGEVSARGMVSSVPARIQLGLKVSEVATQQLQPFASTKSGSTLDAIMSGEILYRYPEKLSSGDIHLAGGRLHSTDGADLMSWDNAHLSNFEYSHSPPLLGIEKLTLDAPRFSYKDNGEHFYSRLNKTVQSSLGEEQDQAETTPTAELHIARVALRNGAIEYRDDRLSPPWGTNISAIEGYIQNLHSPRAQDPVEYSITGDMAGAAFSAQGTLLPSAEIPDQKTVVELENFPLNVLDEQLSNFFDLETADSSLDIYYLYDSANDSSFVKLGISSLAAEDPHSATALTMALLSDNKNTLTETVPLKDPSKSVFTQVVNHFQKLLIKAEVSPYLLLKEPYDTLRENTRIFFEPGKMQLDQEGKQTLSLYAMLLDDAPRIQLVLEASVDRSSDTKALKQHLEQVEKERVRVENERLLRQWQTQRTNGPAPSSADDAISVEDITEEDLQEFKPISVEPIAITDTMLEQLGRDRLEQMRRFLLENQNTFPENIALSPEIALSETSASPYVHITLKQIDAN